MNVNPKSTILMTTLFSLSSLTLELTARRSSVIFSTTKIMSNVNCLTKVETCCCGLELGMSKGSMRIQL